MTVPDLMRAVRNCFPSARMEGVFLIDNQRLSPHDMLLPGDWVAIRGSARNDGIYTVADDGQTLPGTVSETFEGEVWLLKPPKDFLNLCAEIIAWDRAHSPDGLASERFGVYACTRAVDEYGLPVGWEQVFRHRLLPYRRMFWQEGLPC